MLEDRPINDLEDHLLTIIRKYAKDDPYRVVYLHEVSEEDLGAFSVDAIEKILEEYLRSEPPDYVRLRWFLRRLYQVGHSVAVSFCISHIDRMLPATSEICRYLIAVGERGVELDWAGIGERLLSLLQKQVIQSAEYFQLSILSLFGRNTQLDHFATLLENYRSASPFARRKIILVLCLNNYLIMCCRSYIVGSLLPGGNHENGTAENSYYLERRRSKPIECHR